MPHDALAGRIETAVAAALEVHRAELAELVERQVDAERERLAGEFVANAIARRNGGAPAAPSEHGDSAPNRHLENVDVGDEPTKRCTGCLRDLPLDAFGRDARTADGRRRRCRDCRRELEYVPRARRGRDEKASRAARDGPRDDDDDRPAERDTSKPAERLSTARARFRPTSSNAGSSTPASPSRTAAASARPSSALSSAPRSTTR